MANAIFTTKVNPIYDDLPEIRYHFPKTYLGKAEQAVGDWIVYYEPRREDADLSGRAGRKSYFATARVERIEPDPARANHFYAYVRDYLEFDNPVPFKLGDDYLESRLRKEDGSTNKGLFGRSVRIISHEEFQAIHRLGFVEAQPGAGVQPEDSVLAEQPVAYGRTARTQLIERPFRDAAFTRVVRDAYQSTCAITGLKLVNGGGRCEIEAAHIRPVEAQGPDSPRNGIALSRTVHWMFDRGIFSVSESGALLMAARLVPDQIRRMLNPDGKLILPRQSVWRPHPIFLKYHREIVFKGN